MTTPWQMQHDLVRASEAQFALKARDAAQLADWQHRTGRLRVLRRGLAALSALRAGRPLKRQQAVRVGRAAGTVPN